MSAPEPPVQVLPPWVESPFRLWSWLDMLEFSAIGFYRIGSSLMLLRRICEECADHPEIGEAEDIRDSLKTVVERCDIIALKQSANLAKILADTIEPKWLPSTLLAKIECLDVVIRNELQSEQFLWITQERSKFYKKTAADLIGQQALDRFSTMRVDQEADEAMRCYAVGRHTACAFHLMRLVEAGLRAFGFAIGYVAKNNNWGGAFDEYDRQFSAAPKDRPAHWQTHKDFLVDISGDLRATQKAYRNHINHLDHFYSDAEAEYLLRIIPVFFTHLATGLDETGKLYP